MNATIQMAEIARIAQEARYDPETGIFTSTVTKRGRPAGRVMGGRDKNGYVILKIDGVVIKAHRLAWFIVYGALPAGFIDHINGDPSDNRISNLRDVSRRANNLNSWTPRSDNRRSGLIGVSKISGRSKRWAARVTDDGQRIHLGSFATPEEAHTAYLAAKQRILAEALHAN